jgi:hypothetical protein
MRGRRAGLRALLRSGFSLLERLQRQLPRVFQCGGAMPMRRIAVVELALTSGGAWAVARRSACCCRVARACAATSSSTGARAWKNASTTRVSTGSAAI